MPSVGRQTRTSAHAAIRASHCRRSPGGRLSRITRRKTRHPPSTLPRSALADQGAADAAQPPAALRAALGGRPRAPGASYARTSSRTTRFRICEVLGSSSMNASRVRLSTSGSPSESLPSRPSKSAGALPPRKIVRPRFAPGAPSCALVASTPADSPVPGRQGEWLASRANRRGSLHQDADVLPSSAIRTMRREHAHALTPRRSWSGVDLGGGDP
jgi:hypothetical protein